MKPFHLDERLKCIASMCATCQCAIDVGCDHGYLAINLILNKKANKVIASDIAKGPLSAAQKNIEKYHLENRITTMLCNGIPSFIDADLIIIAGMGGLLICDILNSNKNPCHNFILQANNNLLSLRKFLSQNQYKIIDENICKVNDKFYEILKVTAGTQILNDEELEFGPINLVKRTPIFIEKYTSMLNHYLNLKANFNGTNEQLQNIESTILKLKKIIQ